jgi:elongation factor Ts
LFCSIREKDYMVRIATAVDEPNDDRKPNPANGRILTYLHAAGRIGVLLELNCQSELLASSDHFGVLMRDLAMHIAALDPKYISRKDVPPHVSAKEEETVRQETSTSEEVVKRMEKFYQEVCLLEQGFVKEPNVTVGQLIATRSDEWGDDVAVRRFVRFAVGEGETVGRSKPQA